MNSREIRESYLKFFEDKGHLRLKSASLIPKDPTLLFTAAGMVPLKAYYLGEEEPPRRRLTTVQKCLRTNDVDNVGYTTRHHTFFEMLGNFSIGDYFKEEAIPWAYEFVTEVLGLPEEKLWITIYKDDLESKGIWKKVGIPEERIIPLGEDDNFWTMGAVGPCGPCSEIYYDSGAKTPEEEKQLPGDEGERFLEFWNLVFTQYDRQPDGSLKPLPRRNIDTGMGLERITSILEGVETDFETDLFVPIIQEIEKLSGERYKEDSIKDRSFRAISDHIRAVSFLISDGLVPSNEKRGYVLRRLIRRSALFGRAINLQDAFLYKLVPVVVHLMGDLYPELKENENKIIDNLKNEESRFAATLNNGFAYFDDIYKKLKKEGKGEFPAESAFYLYDTLGFPLELTESILRSYGLNLDREKFNELLDKQRERARKAFKGGDSFTERIILVKLKEKIGETQFTGYEHLKEESTVEAILKGTNEKSNAEAGEKVALILNKTPFYAEKGGQVGDTGVIKGQDFLFRVEDTQVPVQGLIIHIGTIEKGAVFSGDVVIAEVDKDRRKAIMRAHTSTHILQAVLREEFGSQVAQQGSAVHPDEFHFDFNFNGKISDEKLIEIERKVNDIIVSSTPVIVKEMPIEEAKRSGALAFFEEKYGDVVRVVEIPNVSKEFCGGTHISNTSEIGMVLLESFRSVASGIRRVEGICGKKAYDEVREARLLLKDTAKILGTSEEALKVRAEKIVKELKDVKKYAETLRFEIIKSEIKDISPVIQGNIDCYYKNIKGATLSDLRKAYDIIKKNVKKGVVILSGSSSGKVFLLVGRLSNEEVSAKDIFDRIGKGFKGGGNERLAQGSGEHEISMDFLKGVL
jgi:alanyl-tRNA synthetase